MAVANQTPRNVANDYATIAFIVQQLTSGMATSTIVRVKACTNEGGVVPVGTCDVQLLVDMITEDGQTFPQGTVFKAPYMRAQGGANAVILDPEPGDLGICVFASRDISPIKSNPESARNRKPSPGAQPGSKRMFSLSDAMYVGGLLNGAPTQFVQFSAAGIVVKSPTKVTLQAPEIDLIGAVVQTGGDVTMAQALDVQGNITTPAEVTAGNIGLTTHKHPTAPTGPVSAPIP